MVCASVLGGKTGVTADRAKIEFRLFNSSSNLVTVGRDSSFPSWCENSESLI